MSQTNNKAKIDGFKLSSSFNQLYSQKKQQTEEFIKEFSDKPHENLSTQKFCGKSLKKPSRSGAIPNSLFKLNTQSQALLSDVAVDYIKKKSQSRLQSIYDTQENKTKFNLLQKVNENDKRQGVTRERKELMKKYNIDLNAVLSQQTGTGSKPQIKQRQMQIQQVESISIVKPSQLYSTNTKLSDPFMTPTIFQTTLLPCFSSEFSVKPQLCTSKTIKQGQGVWRIGKLKIKKNKAILKIGEIEYESQYINSQGRCVGIRQDFLYKTKNWKGIWVCQPKYNQQ